MKTWRTHARSAANRVWLNPFFTSFFDWLSPTNTLGQRGERIAERLLLRNGMHVVDRGYSEKFGEIDLIAVDDRTVVFVEVKTRTSDYSGAPVEAVDEKKQEKISRVAAAYLKRHGLLDCRCRFDVVAIELKNATARPAISYYQDAFEASE